MKFFLISLIFVLTNFVHAQKIDLYSNFGIRSLVHISGDDEIHYYQIKGDTAYFNGGEINSDGVKFVFFKGGNNRPSRIQVGEEYELVKEDQSFYKYRSGEETIKIDLKNPPKGTDFPEKVNCRFLILSAILNYLEENLDFNADENSIQIRKCGTWNIIGYGHSQTSSLFNAQQEAQEFSAANSNCSSLGGPDVSCLSGNLICFTVFSYHCKCGKTIPFIGLGW